MAFADQQPTVLPSDPDIFWDVNSPGGVLSGTALVAESLASNRARCWCRTSHSTRRTLGKSMLELTATYGLRWELNTPLKGKNSANDPFTITSLNDLTTIALAPRGTPLYETTYRNVAPRMGLAYQLHDSKMGFGSPRRRGSFLRPWLWFARRSIQLLPVPGPKFLTFTPFPLSPQDAAPPPFSVNPPVPIIIVSDPHLKLPRTYEWNVDN